MMTPRMAQCLAFVRAYAAAHEGVSPSFAEIATALGLNSKSGVARIIDMLEERGLILRLKKRARGIQILNQDDRHFVDEETLALLLRHVGGSKTLIADVVRQAVREFIARHPEGA